jgi:hypothetical protein
MLNPEDAELLAGLLKGGPQAALSENRTVH